jgi:alpha-N-acetylglucosaminidase
MLHDFGGNNYLFGSLDNVTSVIILLCNMMIVKY